MNFTLGYIAIIVTVTFAVAVAIYQKVRTSTDQTNAALKIQAAADRVTAAAAALRIHTATVETIEPTQGDTDVARP